MSLTDRLSQRHYAGGDSGAWPTRAGVGSAAALRVRVHRELLAILGPQLYDQRTGDQALEQKVRETINDVLARDDSPLAVADPARVAAELIDEILGHGPVEPLLRDPDITEIMVNGPNRIFVERFGQIHQVDATFVDEDHLRRVIDRIVWRVGRRVDEASPMVDARLPDGSRVNVVLPPIALDGSMLTIRKFAREAFTVDDLIGFGTVTQEVAQLLYACVRGRLDIVISGGTGSGKTTTLNVLSGFIPPNERIVTIEDAAELQLRQDHVLRLEARPPNIEGRGEITIRDLVRNSLRMRPDRIVIGEVRDGAALDLLQAMNTGHNGSLTTVHANAPRDSIARLETMAMMAGLDLPVRAIREQLASAVDLILHQDRLRDGSRRVTHVSEVIGMEGEVVTLQDLFVFDHRAGLDEHGRHRGTLRWTGLRPKFLDTLADSGIPLPAGLFESPPW
ncbi:type II secretion system protein E [Asanoa ishikariensis]|uniref:Pilus assembly protein CpaF n=1 Tax=Asanoa ishikariensis TaxID=137265 RepID=A0A1H3UGZ4_9ACTN|nr:CpaF family protein [Asanoa ishikariensis]GIF63698.1 type II secretion system protein E [Asanoa ishikariensis]SDZ60929.1 pilus assembly protein CpaF [Asanoa ishikariensis]